MNPFFDVFGMWAQSSLFDNQIPIIPKMNAELIKFRKYLVSIRPVIGDVSGLIKQNSFPCIDEYSRPQRIMIPMNKITLNVLFNFGLVTAGLYLKSVYHSLYPKYDIPRPTIADIDAKGRPYPLIMSHRQLPTTAPIVP